MKNKKLAEHIFLNVKKHNYAEIPFSILQGELHIAASHFLNFLSLPQKKKEKFYLLLDHKDDSSQIGYVRRAGEKSEYGTRDDKEYFHYNEHVPEKFGALLAEAEPEVKDFIATAAHIYSHATRKLDEIMGALNKIYPGIHRRFFPLYDHPKFYLRFLKYNTRGKGSFLARAHYDRGGCTLALSESAPGLRIGKNDATLKEVEHRDGQALFMPALKFHKLTSADFHPAWHDVIQKREDAINTDVARWAIVLFADPYDMAPVNETETHTPLTNSKA